MCLSFELLMSLFYATVFIMFLSADNGVSLLVVSELAWSTVYCLFVVAGSCANSVVLLAGALPTLILASVDCGLWMLSLALYNHLSKAASFDESAAGYKFVFRSNRLVQSNRFVK